MNANEKFLNELKRNDAKISKAIKILCVENSMNSGHFNLQSELFNN